MDRHCVRCDAYITAPEYGMVQNGRACRACLSLARAFLRELVGEELSYDEYGVTVEWHLIEKLMRRHYDQPMREFRIPMKALV